MKTFLPLPHFLYISCNCSPFISPMQVDLPFGTHLHLPPTEDTDSSQVDYYTHGLTDVQAFTGFTYEGWWHTWESFRRIAHNVSINSWLVASWTQD